MIYHLLNRMLKPPQWVVYQLDKTGSNETESWIISRLDYLLLKSEGYHDLLVYPSAIVDSRFWDSVLRFTLWLNYKLCKDKFAFSGNMRKFHWCFCFKKCQYW